MNLTRIVVAASVALLGCARTNTSHGDQATAAPAFMLGEFQDDYGERHSITSTEWAQRPRNRFHIVRWAPDRRYLIAQNDSANVADGAKWTRIDWVQLDSPPYIWAFCFSAYRAPTLAVAESVSVAKPETPRTGCNGNPYTRMRAP